MRTSLCCWYEVVAPDDLLIWEGICAIRIASDKTLVLVKLISGMPVFTQLGIWHGKIRSDGYWTCAQLEGEFRSGDQIFYHCKSPQDAFTMIHNLEAFLDSRLHVLSVRLDPDPLRLQDHRSIESRMNQWNRLKHCVAANRFRLIPDSTMPL